MGETTPTSGTLAGFVQRKLNSSRGRANTKDDDEKTLEETYPKKSHEDINIRTKERILMKMNQFIPGRQ
jgi:hypothetical protein